ncbi:MAG: formate hydrogenlyase [Nitrospinota bacterium]
MIPAVEWHQEIISATASLLLLTSFGLLAQHRMSSVLNLYAIQGIVLAGTTAFVGYTAGRHELYISAILTLALKGILLPWLLWKIIRELKVHREVEPFVNMPTTMLIALALVIFSFAVSLPLERISTLLTRNTLAIATATLFLSMLMMITRKKAITQVIGFLAIENSVFFAAIGATYGMPMVVELGVAFDVLIASLIFTLFFFQIHSTFDSLDLEAMKKEDTK